MTVTAAETQQPKFTASEFLREIQRRGGRVYRYRIVAVCCLTNSPEVAQWLITLGGQPYKPSGFKAGPDGGYRRAEGLVEWDIYVHSIPVRGEESVWEAAGRNRRVEAAA